MKIKYKLSISYNGTNYAGWQIQPNALSVQSLLQEKLKILVKHPIKLVGSGRTDAGVHAEEQVAHFSTDKPLSISSFLYSLNALLPKDIRITAMEEVPLSFHARYSAVAKTYRYYISLQSTPSAFLWPFRLHVRGDLDMQLIKQAMKRFIGTHDFTSFANAGSSVRTTTKTIYHFDLFYDNEGFFFEITGDGFLYKMVRNIIGTLLAIGQKKLTLEDLETIFLKKNRTTVPKAAAAHGLFLHKAHYTETDCNSSKVISPKEEKRLMPCKRSD